MKIIIVLLISALVIGCTYTRSQVLIHPETKEMVKCEFGGWGFGYIGYPVMRSQVNSLTEKCVTDYKLKGYTEMK